MLIKLINKKLINPTKKFVNDLWQSFMDPENNEPQYVQNPIITDPDLLFLERCGIIPPLNYYESEQNSLGTIDYINEKAPGNVKGYSKNSK